MVFVLNIDKSPLSLKDIEKIVNILSKRISLYGLREPVIEYIYIVECRAISKYCKEGFIAVNDKSCIRYGVIIICGDVLLNIFIEEFMRAYYALAMLETYDEILVGAIDKFIRENFMKVLIDLKKDS